MYNFDPVFPPFDHQRAVHEETSSRPGYALFWEQGTGKTKAAIDLNAQLFKDGQVNGHLIVAPEGVHENWILEQLPEHLPEELRSQTAYGFFSSGKSRTKRHVALMDALVRWRGLAVLAMPYDGFMTDVGKKAAWEFLKNRRCLYTVDESQRIKTPKAKRTKSILMSARYAPYRRVLSGTPITKGPFDVYSQMKFVVPDIWVRHGLDSYAAFKARYGNWKQLTLAGGRKVDVLDQELPYLHLEELYEIIAPHSDRVLKEDVLDLPPKLYSRHVFDLSANQRRMYNEIRDDFRTLLEAKTPCRHCDATGKLEYGDQFFDCDACNGEGEAPIYINAELAVTRLLRLQQITCGYIPDDLGTPIHDIPGPNPRLDAMVGRAEDCETQAIIWCRFTRDIDKLMDAIGARAVRYDGKTGADDRRANKSRFKGGEAQFIVANTQAMSTGHTYNEAKTNFYYSNSFMSEHRMQSEDRSHRSGQDTSVLYVDMCARNTVDSKIIKTLRGNLDVASAVLGDGVRSWLEAEPEEDVN